MLRRSTTGLAFAGRHRGRELRGLVHWQHRLNDGNAGAIMNYQLRPNGEKPIP
jgi:hypothetical protein